MTFLLCLMGFIDISIWKKELIVYLSPTKFSQESTFIKVFHSFPKINFN